MVALIKGEGELWEISKSKQERLMFHKKYPVPLTVWTLVLIMAFMLACTFPASLAQRPTEDIDTVGAIVDANLEEPEPVVETPTAAVLAQPHGSEAAPTPQFTPTPPGPGPASEPLVYYHVQPGTPIGLPNIWHKELGCEWMGVGGQVFGAEGWPEDETLVVELGGTLAGEPVSAITLTGTATQWGPSGYEFSLAPQPLASNQSLWVQFYDIEGIEVSPRILFDTYEDCEQNAILLNLIHVERAEFERLYLPVLGQMFFPGNR
jgi:hypothetical protein